MDGRIFVLDLLPVKLESAVCNIGSTKNSSKVNDTFSGLTIYIDADYPDGSSHSGRRSMITRLAKKGIDVNSIRIIAGHSSLQTTQRYIEENPARLANILKGL
jgi:site-specific recombinase XerD